jgi:hypothetical protein
MKKLLVTITMVALAVGTMYGQGRIGFDNLGTGNTITVGPLNQGPSGGAAGANIGANYSIQLLWAPVGTYANEAAFLAAIVGQSAAVQFFGVTGGGPTTDGAGLFDGGSVPVPVGSYTVQARAWFNTGFNSYDLAFAAGMNTGTSAFQNLDSTAPPTPAQFTSFPSFTVGAVPEPSTFALAGLGVASLLLFRRRK